MSATLVGRRRPLDQRSAPNRPDPHRLLEIFLERQFCLIMRRRFVRGALSAAGGTRG